MDDKIQQVQEEALLAIENAKTMEELRDIRIQYLGKKGSIQALMSMMKDLSKEEKPAFGQKVNVCKSTVTESLDAKQVTLEASALSEKLKEEKIDITLAGDKMNVGTVHPLHLIQQEVEDLFIGMGYKIAEGPEVELDHYNFELANIPKDHPARDMQDTFYTNVAENVVLRSQTSGAQIHAMEGKNPPIRIIAPGRVYRNENINSRKNNFFHQIEGLYVDKNITFGDLKGVLNEFIRIYFGESRPTRFRSSFFPFTEPSAEVDVQCIMCSGKGCRTCSGTGWLEVLGAGMVDPNVLRGVGIDPDVYSGFAFGMGVERLAMLKYAVDDIRLFFNNDVRFLKQFK